MIKRTVKMVDITILRQCGTRRHDDPVYHLKEKGYINNINRILYSVPRHVGEGIVHKTFIKNSLDALRYVHGIINLPLCSDLNIIVGVAPYSMSIPYLLHLKKHNNIIYHNSWPYWNGEKYVKKPYFSNQITMWERFLDGVKAISVTKRANEEVERLGAKGYHIPHPVDTRIFKPTLNEVDEDERVKILFVGYMVESKGVLDLLDIAKNFDPREVEFWFVGKGKLAKNVEEMERKYPVKHFGFISDREELAKIYSKADIFVLPSRELFGIVLIEAMACGLPVISVDSVGPRDIINDGVDGFIMPRKDKNILLNKLKVLVNDGKLRKKMGGKGREKAVSRYDVEVIAKKWWDVIND
ncbi:MAG: glycosyltransferase family 4 protein [Methanosarcinales archaeon]|nr:MAG: glycosyltransferase family 4 protein [Methanosarcinales archaeon]